MVNSSEFAKRLQNILQFYGLTATAFSEEIDFNRSTISHLLSGRNKPSLEFVMKVVTKFPEVELYWLLNGKGEFPPISEQSPTSLRDIPKESGDSKITAFPSEKNKFPNTEDIERIVIFYKDGSYKAYKN